MTKQTAIGVGLIILLVVVAGVVASTLPMHMPLPNSLFASQNQKPNAPVLFEPTNPNASSTQGTPSDLPVLADHMPPFVGITKWWNTPDGQLLTPESLKGKVVLVDFWTYSCINCIRTFPFIKSMYAKYASKGLVIVGVHTPEFAFEAKPENVEAEIKKNGFMHPIALDANYGTWGAYSNQYWPAEYFFDRKGQLRKTHFGEGEYDANEQAIRSLLEESPGVDLGAAGVSSTNVDFSKIVTHETYFGLARGREFMGTPGAAGSDASFTIQNQVTPDRWTIGGTWRFTDETIETKATNDVLRFSVQAEKMHIVLDSTDGTDKSLEIYVDGKKVKDLTVNRSTLYDIAEFPDAARHTVEIRIPDAGVRFYAATFS